MIEKSMKQQMEISITGLMNLAIKILLWFFTWSDCRYRLFEKQIEYFEDKYNVFVWMLQEHGVSWPFKLDFTLMDKAEWLDEIFIKENIVNPVIIGQ